MKEPDAAFWKRKQSRIAKRQVAVRTVRETFLIVCEGEKTEPNYFNSFRLTSSQVKDEIFGPGDNTVSLVEKTIKYKKDAATYGIKFDQIWCVFDKDDNPDDNFEKAIALAKKHDIKVAYSNECFELWYLLHFQYHQTASKRSEYITRLSALLGKPYEKNSTEIYQLILNKQGDGIRNASRLLSGYIATHPASVRRPSTTVHILVNELNKFLV
ncbi:MAG: RloB domain-containing protein [Candidatus Omnitrophica bacterium]|nr:RloB domain-containing protein [Candidatus Omnitrophota bacterium]